MATASAAADLLRELPERIEGYAIHYSPGGPFRKLRGAS
jgi:hypothetical protein